MKRALAAVFPLGSGTGSWIGVAVDRLVPAKKRDCGIGSHTWSRRGS